MTTENQSVTKSLLQDFKRMISLLSPREIKKNLVLRIKTKRLFELLGEKDLNPWESKITIQKEIRI